LFLPADHSILFSSVLHFVLFPPDAWPNPRSFFNGIPESKESVFPARKKSLPTPFKKDKMNPPRALEERIERLSGRADWKEDGAWRTVFLSTGWEGIDARREKLGSLPFSG